MRIGVIGATGALGREIVAALAESADELNLLRNPPLLFATTRSVGETFPWVGDEELEIEELTADNVRGLEAAVVAVPEKASAEVLSILRPLGIVAVDTSRAHRATAPLFGEGISAPRLANESVVALPSAEALMVARALRPLASQGIRGVRAEVLLAASGAGHLGVQELAESTASLLNGQEPKAPGFPHRLAFNLVPQAGSFDDGTTQSENDLSLEVSTLLGKEGRSIPFASTVSWGPWFYGYFATVTVSFENPMSVDQARELLREGDGVKLLDDPGEGVYPMPSLATGDEAVLVGRVRTDPLEANGLRFAVSMDNVRGSAMNAIAAVRALSRARNAH